jgi:predicted  nucleic acid-binding Zn-ribbon protein
MIDDPVRTELAELRETMTAGFATMHEGFARMDRYFELQQAQHVELRGDVGELRGEVRELRVMVVALTTRVDTIEVRLDRLENQVGAFRDWVAGELVDIRRDLRQLRAAAEEREDFRRDVAALDVRVTRLEKDWGSRPD